MDDMIKIAEDILITETMARLALRKPEPKMVFTFHPNQDVFDLTITDYRFNKGDYSPKTQMDKDIEAVLRILNGVESVAVKGNVIKINKQPGFAFKDLIPQLYATMNLIMYNLNGQYYLAYKSGNYHHRDLGMDMKFL